MRPGPDWARCPGVALAVVAAGVAGTTALLAPCLAAAGLGTVGAIGAACLTAVFAVVLVIVSLSVLAGCVGCVGRDRRAVVALAAPHGSANGGGRRGVEPGIAPFTGILSVSGRYWPFGRASPRRGRPAVAD
jgi:hypothetical protein